MGVNEMIHRRLVVVKCLITLRAPKLSRHLGLVFVFTNHNFTRFHRVIFFFCHRLKIKLNVFFGSKTDYFMSLDTLSTTRLEIAIDARSNRAATVALPDLRILGFDSAIPAAEVVTMTPAFVLFEAETRHEDAAALVAEVRHVVVIDFDVGKTSPTTGEGEVASQAGLDVAFEGRLAADQVFTH